MLALIFIFIVTGIFSMVYREEKSGKIFKNIHKVIFWVFVAVTAMIILLCTLTASIIAIISVL